MTNFTKIYNEYKPQIEKLNRQFKKLQEHTQDLSYTNLKLYDVSFYIYDMKDDNNIFDTLGYGLESETEIIFDSGSLEYAYYELENVLNYDLQDEDNLEDLESEIDVIIDDLKDYLQAYYEEIKAVRRAYKWLENYKKYQVESFKDFVENNEF